MKIFLIGMMGSGKTSVGELLSKSLNLKFVDIDQVIQKEEGETINGIFKKNGEAYFREIESITLKKIKDYAIVSCGGGIIKKEATIHISNLMLIDPKSGNPTKVGKKIDKKTGKLVRFAKNSGEVIK